MKKTGFTLVELLAVIAVLGLILILAIPKVMDTLNTQKKRTLELTTKSIIKAAEEKYLENSAYGINEKITCESVSNITSADFESCNISFDEVGNAIVTIEGKGRYEGLKVCNGTKQNANVTSSKEECTFTCKDDETLVENVKATKPYVIKSKSSCIAFATELGNQLNYTEEEFALIEPFCSGQTVNEMTFDEFITMFIGQGILTERELIESNVIEGKIEKECQVLRGLQCTYDRELVHGAEFTHNQYTYKYMHEYGIASENQLVTGWVNIGQEGWGVKLTDLNSTLPVNTPICSYINGKPVVSTSMMFFGGLDASNGYDVISTKASSIDVSFFDTSNVTNMMGMFAGITGLTEIKGLDKLNTSNVTNMSMMFLLSGVTALDLSSWDTSNVTDMNGMFGSCSATSIDLSSWDTSKVTNMGIMFWATRIETLDLSSFNTSKVTNMVNMFEEASIGFLDLSSFDTSNADMRGMFNNGGVTSGYARTQADADRLNNEAYSAIFIVKPS